MTIAPPSPPLRLAMRCTAARATRIAPVTLRSMTARIVCGAALSIGLDLPGDAGIVDEMRQASELLVDARKDALDVGFERHVALENLAWRAAGAAFARDALGRLLVALIVERDRVAVLRGEAAHRGADAARAAGDEQELSPWRVSTAAPCGWRRRAGSLRR